jgi:ribosome-binding protein aMBF1 (putative translation factor)
MIKAICKICGREAPAEQFVLDVDFKKMVCPACVKDKHKREAMLKQVKEGQVKF